MKNSATYAKVNVLLDIYMTSKKYEFDNLFKNLPKFSKIVIVFQMCFEISHSAMRIFAAAYV